MPNVLLLPLIVFAGMVVLVAALTLLPRHRRDPRRRDGGGDGGYDAGHGTSAAWFDVSEGCGGGGNGGDGGE